MVTEAVYDGALLVVVDAHDTVHELGLCVGGGVVAELDGARVLCVESVRVRGN